MKISQIKVLDKEKHVNEWLREYDGKVEIVNITMTASIDGFGTEVYYLIHYRIDEEEID